MTQNLTHRSLPFLTKVFQAVTIFGSLNLIWEVAQLPLYTLWSEGRWPDILFAVVHCTAGDVLIGITASAIAYVVTRTNLTRDFVMSGSFAFAFIALGLTYTIYSEWLNVSIRGNWAYSELMPLLPPLGTGLSPALQWLIVPLLTICIFGQLHTRRPTTPPL